MDRRAFHRKVEGTEDLFIGGLCEDREKSGFERERADYGSQ